MAQWCPCGHVEAAGLRGQGGRHRPDPPHGQEGPLRHELRPAVRQTPRQRAGKPRIVGELTTTSQVNNITESLYHVSYLNKVSTVFSNYLKVLLDKSKGCCWCRIDALLDKFQSQSLSLCFLLSLLTSLKLYHYSLEQITFYFIFSSAICLRQPPPPNGWCTSANGMLQGAASPCPTSGWPPRWPSTPSWATPPTSSTTAVPWWPTWGTRR